MSNSKVASIKVSGNKATVKGLKAGKIILTVVNNGKTAKKQITVAQKDNPIKASPKAKTLKVKDNKKVVFTKAKAFVITGAKGTVVFKKTKGNKKISITSAGKVIVDKGIKKGSYKVNVSVTAKGNKVYKAATKKVTLNISITK